MTEFMKEKHFGEGFKKLKETWFEGEVTLTKASLWMIAGLCLLAGIIHGLRMAPMTHGVIIGCGNGNGSGCGSDCEAGTGKLEQGKECGCKKACKNRKEKKQR